MQHSTLELIDTENPVNEGDLIHQSCAICYPDDEVMPDYAYCGYKFKTDVIIDDAPDEDICVVCDNMAENHFNKKHSEESKRFPNL